MWQDGYILNRILFPYFGDKYMNSTNLLEFSSQKDYSTVNHKYSH